MSYTRHLLLLFIVTGIPFLISAQGTAINENGADPHGSAMLDVVSTTKGVLIPRMTTAQRTGIAAPATGLLVYDQTTHSFWYRMTAGWVELTDNFHGLRDADHDTRVQVEESPDEDIIRFDIGGKEAMVLTESTAGHTRLEIGPEIGLMIGRYAGETSNSGWNTFVGYEAGRYNTTGERNVFLGYRTGQNNGASQDRNVLIGYEAGINNNAWSNTYVGYQSGHTNTTGASNTFIGYIAGVQNTTGYRNTYLGAQAGHNTEQGFENTFVGHNAGYFNDGGDLNTFVGVSAGGVNRTGLYNTVIGARAAGNSLSNRDLSNGNSILGYEAAFFASNIGRNTLMGYRAGYNMTTGFNNVYLGYQAGLLTQGAISNVAIGIDALRQNSNGHRNVAVGDSALYFTTAGSNVAVGSKAGMDNTTGASNTFVGPLAGENNTTGGSNVMVGSNAGAFNRSGQYNTIVGTNAGSSNFDGNQNTMMGYYAGWRNSSGNFNIFLGPQSADNNIDGNNNIGIGQKALSRNSDGNYNIAIGDHALGFLSNDGLTILGNIAIGREAAFQASGNNNIVVGNDAAYSLSGINNIVIGNDAADQMGMGSHNVVIGNASSGTGLYNTLVGAETAAAWPFAPEGATALGYGAQISQDFSVILGDASNVDMKVGIGTETPSARLQVAAPANVDPLRVQANGAAKMILDQFGGTTLGSSDILYTAENGLRVHGVTNIGHPLSIDPGPGKLFNVYGLSEFHEKVEFQEETTVNHDLIVTGTVGIGATSPPAKVGIMHDSWQLLVTNADAPGNNWFFGASSSDWAVNDNNLLVLSPTNSSLDGIIYVDRLQEAVGINTGNVPAGYAFAVKGDIIAERVRVELLAAWPDYVFDDDYRNPSLQEIAEHIEIYGHLPGVPSADEVSNEGVDLGEMQRVLLEKIEQLTLHMIELEKQNSRLQSDLLKLQTASK